LGLKVDLVHSDQVVDAENVLASNIHDEATHPADVDVPQAAVSDIDVTEESTVDEFESAPVNDEAAAPSDDGTDDMALIGADDAAATDETTESNEEKEA
jgi:hypothetical protein